LDILIILSMLNKHHCLTFHGAPKKKSKSAKLPLTTSMIQNFLLEELRLQNSQIIFQIQIINMYYYIVQFLILSFLSSRKISIFFL